MNIRDPAFEAKGILRQVRRPDAEEFKMRAETRVGWEDEALKRAGTFVQKLSENKARLPPGVCCWTPVLPQPDIPAVTKEQIHTENPSKLNDQHARCVGNHPSTDVVLHHVPRGEMLVWGLPDLELV